MPCPSCFCSRRRLVLRSRRPEFIPTQSEHWLAARIVIPRAVFARGIRFLRVLGPSNAGSALSVSGSYADTTESAPCSLRVGRTIICTSWAQRRKKLHQPRQRRIPRPLPQQQGHLRLRNAKNLPDLHLRQAAALEQGIDVQSKLRFDRLLFGVRQPHVRKHIPAAFSCAPDSTACLF